MPRSLGEMLLRSDEATINGETSDRWLRRTSTTVPAEGLAPLTYDARVGDESRCATSTRRRGRLATIVVTGKIDD